MSNTNMPSGTDYNSKKKSSRVYLFPSPSAFLNPKNVIDRESDVVTIFWRESD